MRIDRGMIVWLLIAACVVVLIYLLIDHVLFPTLPVPAGTPPIVK